MMSTKAPPEIKRFIQDESEGIKKNIPFKWKQTKKVEQQYLYMEKKTSNQRP